MTDESLDDPVREIHAHFDGLLRVLTASGLQVAERRMQRRLYAGEYLGRQGPSSDRPTGSALVDAAAATATVTGAVGNVDRRPHGLDRSG